MKKVLTAKRKQQKNSTTFWLIPVETKTAEKKNFWLISTTWLSATWHKEKLNKLIAQLKAQQVQELCIIKSKHMDQLIEPKQKNREKEKDKFEPTKHKEPRPKNEPKLLIPIVRYRIYTQAWFFVFVW